MKFLLKYLALITMITNVWGTVKEVTHNLKKYYVVNANYIVSSSLPIYFGPAELVGMTQQGNVISLRGKNTTNEILRIWTGSEKLIEFGPNQEKTISWNIKSPLMILTKDASAALDQKTYLEIIQRLPPL
ncbi:hypothetical protein PGT21_013561 [Puccinia graminis f. sp. tritici]|uniref:Uncharacterized protein n=1 Tax=Puccinia graminis f. sp. tritici TaxID=56615 RepID=A0A5B0MMR4_PUCGR|nr:hypothetical protein PGT21_013561 [Puccinia graminis f. sp. tritici]